MQENFLNEKGYLKYLRILFFFCSASLFPLSLISSGNQYIFQFLSVPIFSINSGFLFHKIVSKHVLLQLNKIRVSRSYIVTITYYFALYAIGVFWANLFIDRQGRIKLNSQLFLFLPIVNGLLFLILFGIRYFRLSLNSSFEGIFDSQASGLAIIDLKVRKMYDETLLKKNEIKKQIVDQIEQQKYINNEIDSQFQKSPFNKNKQEAEIGMMQNIESQSQILNLNQNNFNEINSQIMSPRAIDEKLPINISAQVPIYPNERNDAQQIFVHSRQSSQTQIPQNQNQINQVKTKNRSQIVNFSEKAEQQNTKTANLQRGFSNQSKQLTLKQLKSIDLNDNEQIRFLKILIGLYLIFVSIILQIIFSVNITKSFQFLLDQNIYFIYLICMSYPAFIGLIKLIPVTINSVMNLRYEWQIQFLSLFFASLPYRGLYLDFNTYKLGLGIIGIKFFYKLLVYYLQFKFASQLFDLKKKINMKIKKQEKDGNVLQTIFKNIQFDFTDLNVEKNSNDKKKNIKAQSALPPQSIENGLNEKEKKQQILDKNEDQFNGYQEIEQLLNELKDKGQVFYQMIYKLEMIQFSDILHMICVLVSISINASLNSNKTQVQSIQAFIDNKEGIVVIFFIELILELIYTVLVTNLIGKIQDFYKYSFSKFMSDIFNFSRKQFLYIFASILCSYSILFIVINNE